MVKILTLTVANYRGIGAEQTFQFARPTGSNASGLTILVGPNNAGKSTVLKLLDGIYSNDDQFVVENEDRRAELVPSVSSSYLLNGEIKSVSVGQAGNSAYITKVGRPSGGAHCVFIPARRPWRDRFSRQANFTWESFQSGIDSNRRNDEHYIDHQFGNALHSIETNAPLKEHFLSLVKFIEPTIIDFWVGRAHGQDYLAFKSISGVAHRVGIVGEGVQNIFRLCHTLMSLQDHQALLLDEPELSLHPQSQRRLYQLLARRAADRQVIVSTHSVHFVDWAHIRSGTKIYRANLTEMIGSTFHELSHATVSKITSIADDDVKNRRAFDALAKEVFFTRGCVLVEGYEDAHLLQSFFESIGFHEIEIFGYGAGGADGIVAWLHACNDLGIRAVAVFDGDAKGVTAFEKATQVFGQNESFMLRKIPERDIRDKHKRSADCKKEIDEIEVEGVFTRKWQVKEHHKEYMIGLATEIANFLKANVGVPDFS